MNYRIYAKILAEVKRNARKNNNGTHWMDTGYGNGSGKFWAAETQINERPLKSLKPRELKQRALTAGAVQADIVPGETTGELHDRLA